MTRPQQTKKFRSGRKLFNSLIRRRVALQSAQPATSDRWSRDTWLATWFFIQVIKWHASWMHRSANYVWLWAIIPSVWLMCVDWNTTRRPTLWNSLNPRTLDPQSCCCCNRSRFRNVPAPRNCSFGRIVRTQLWRLVALHSSRTNRFFLCVCVLEFSGCFYLVACATANRLAGVSCPGSVVATSFSDWWHQGAITDGNGDESQLEPKLYNFSRAVGFALGRLIFIVWR